MPKRSELNPRDMCEFLTHVNLVDVWPTYGGGSVDYQVSLQGAHGFEDFGQLAHRNLDASLSVVTARRLRECLDQVRDSQLPVRVSARVTGGDNPWLDCECLLAPLDGERGRLTTIMWVLVSWATDDGRRAQAKVSGPT